MSVRDVPTKLKLLAKYVSEMTSSERNKFDMLMGWLRPNIAKDMMMGDNPLKNFLKALDRALRFETMRQRMTRDKELFMKPTLLAPIQR